MQEQKKANNRLLIDVFLVLKMFAININTNTTIKKVPIYIPKFNRTSYIIL